MNAWPNHDQLTNQSNGFNDQSNTNPNPSLINPQAMFAAPNGNLNYQNHLQHQHQNPQLVQQHLQQLQQQRVPTPQQSFPYQVNPVVPSKRPRPGDDGVGASPRQPPNTLNLSRSQTPQQAQFPSNISSSHPGGHAQPHAQSTAPPNALQAPNPYSHLQNAGSTNATPSPTMSNQQYRPPQAQSRMQTLSPNPSFASQSQQPPPGMGMSPGPDPAARINTPQSAQFPNVAQSMAQQPGSQMPGQNFNMGNASMPQFNPNFAAGNPNMNAAMGGQFPSQVTLPPNLAQQQAQTQRLYQMNQMKQAQMHQQQQMMASNMAAQQQARQAQAGNMNAMMNVAAQNPNMGTPNRPAQGMTPQQQAAANAQMQNRAFVSRVANFLSQRGLTVEPSPTVCGRPIMLYQLFQILQRSGGSRGITMGNRWAFIAQNMGFPPEQYPTAGAELKEVFDRNLGHWEAAFWQEQKAKQGMQQGQPGMNMNQPQMSPTRTMPQTPQNPAQAQYMQQLQAQRMSQTPQGAPSTPSQVNAQLPTANGWSTPQTDVKMPQQNQFAQHKKSMSRQPDGSPAPTHPMGFPAPSPAMSERKLDIKDEVKPLNGMTAPPPEEEIISDPTNYVPKSGLLTNTWGGIEADMLGQIGANIAMIKPNVPHIDEMGVVDMRALTLSLQSGIHSEVRHALDVMAVITGNPAVFVDLDLCDDLLDVLIDCAEEQVDLLSEDAAEVSDVVEPKSYDELSKCIRVELEGLQDIAEAGTLAWNLDRAADRLIACTSVMRNLSFGGRNFMQLAEPTAIKFISNLARLLGTRELLLRNYVNTQQCMQDIVVLLSNIADHVLLPSREDTSNILHFLLSFAPEPIPTSSATLRFPLYNPRSNRYFPHALDSLAKLLARDEPNRSYFRDTLLEVSSASSQDNIPIHQRYDTFTRTFGMALAILPDRASVVRPPHMKENDLVIKIAEARQASLSQGMLAADILASLLPPTEPALALARAWIDSEDGWAASLFRLVIYMCHHGQQHAEVNGPQANSRRGSLQMPPGRAGRDESTVFQAVSQRALGVIKKLSIKAGDSLSLTADTTTTSSSAPSTKITAIKSQPSSSDTPDDGLDKDVLPLDLGLDIKREGSEGSMAPKMNGISSSHATEDPSIETEASMTSLIDADYDRARFWSGVVGEILPKPEILFGAFATPAFEMALLRDFVELADLAAS